MILSFHPLLLLVLLPLILLLQLKKKAHQLEEQLDYEMQAKDELEHKFKYVEPPTPPDKRERAMYK